MLREQRAGAQDAIDAARRLSPGVAGELVEQNSLASSARAGRAPGAPSTEMGTPVLVGARGREGATQRLVRAAVDLGLELRRHGIQGLLEVRVVATTVRLLQPLPRAQGAGRRRAGHVPA